MIKDLIAQIRAKLTDEELSKVSAALKAVEAEVNDMEDNLKSANAESKNRKIKIREHEKTIEELNDDIEDLNTKIASGGESLKNAEKYKADYDALIVKQNEIAKAEWLKLSKVFDVKEGDKMFDKISAIKEDFKFPNENEELTNEDIMHNLKIIKPYQKINYFEIEKTENEFHTGKPTGNPPNKTKDPFKAFPGE